MTSAIFLYCKVMRYDERFVRPISKIIFIILDILFPGKVPHSKSKRFKQATHTRKSGGEDGKTSSYFSSLS